MFNYVFGLPMRIFDCIFLIFCSIIISIVLSFIINDEYSVYINELASDFLLDIKKYAGKHYIWSKK